MPGDHGSGWTSDVTVATASEPLLFGATLVAVTDSGSDRSLAAIDTTTGKTLWQQDVESSTGEEVGNPDASVEMGSGTANGERVVIRADRVDLAASGLQTTRGATFATVVSVTSGSSSGTRRSRQGCCPRTTPPRGNGGGAGVIAFDAATGAVRSQLDTAPTGGGR